MSTTMRDWTAHALGTTDYKVIAHEPSFPLNPTRLILEVAEIRRAFVIN